MPRPPAQPVYTRMALFPGLLGAIVLLAGLALIGGAWYIGVLYATSILALIMCVFAAQAKQFWWYFGLIPLAVIWNPVWPITLDDLLVRLLHIVGAAVFVAAGLAIKVPEPANH
ncbi:MAG: DUF6804 family protein [Microbacteriaceae bacterium]